ncbi:succinylglutamate desuccinylase/aspartoacylase family protein [Pseudomonas promysalinigenes]|uniref:succinylglutamate desuccinylase/aspartoacylase family protein n=1 Tax=Pseudomonas promysalinigenes TaxID=485898 RepID=UPI001647AACB|nr:succinylglutamate desuccinylase/aspartoacylase family protein [Pseudomonas promysalinigenes]QXI32047.1 succinylglutamate desuccinylase/aspartoacylase family protein [Pseudomonas promysalinigenes]
MPSSEIYVLPSFSPGASHQLVKHSFGVPGRGRSAYLQAATHADEHPGLLVLQHLMELLIELEQSGQIVGRIEIVPYANPIGLGQQLFGQMPGRYNMANGENFNRSFPDITEKVRRALKECPPTPNDTHRLKAIFAEAIEDIAVDGAVDAGKAWLLKQALKHDILIDLHCDTSSILHIYSNWNQQARALALAAATHVEAVFLEDEAGGFPLDEAYAKAWKEAHHLGLVDTQHLGFSATLELRGQIDVDDEMAAVDAAGIIEFLKHEGVIAGGCNLANAEPAKIYPLEGVTHLKSPATGVVAWKKKPGDPVAEGELIAEVVPIDLTPGSSRIPVLSNLKGILVARHHVKLTRQGQKLGMLAGTTPLAHRRTGKLMGI